MNTYQKTIKEAAMSFDKERLNTIKSDIAGAIKQTESFLVEQEKMKNVASILINNNLLEDDLKSYDANICIYKERLEQYNHLIEVINDIQKVL